MQKFVKASEQKLKESNTCWTVKKQMEIKHGIIWQRKTILVFRDAFLHCGLKGSCKTTDIFLFSFILLFCCPGKTEGAESLEPNPVRSLSCSSLSSSQYYGRVGNQMQGNLTSVMSREKKPGNPAALCSLTYAGVLHEVASLLLSTLHLFKV